LIEILSSHFEQNRIEKFKLLIRLPHIFTQELSVQDTYYSVNIGRIGGQP